MTRKLVPLATMLTIVFMQRDEFRPSCNTASLLCGLVDHVHREAEGFGCATLRGIMLTHLGSNIVAGHTLQLPQHTWLVKAHESPGCAHVCTKTSPPGRTSCAHEELQFLLRCPRQPRRPRPVVFESTLAQCLLVAGDAPRLAQHARAATSLNSHHASTRASPLYSSMADVFHCASRASIATGPVDTMAVVASTAL